MNDEKYIVNSAERTTRSASLQETKTLLYLMGNLEDSKDLETFVIDVCNDIVAVNKNHYYDAQAKGDCQCSPKEIGEDLVTLYKDYLSIFNFDMYLLSIRDVSLSNLKVFPDKPIFRLKICDFTKEAQDIIKESLIDECCSKTYIRDCYNDFLLHIDDFLGEVIILINNDEKCNYISKISFADMGGISSYELSSIFEEIRDKQLAIKSLTDVNGASLSLMSDQLKLGRNFDVEIINNLIFERIVGMSIVNNASSYCPILFINYLTSYSKDIDEQQELLQECVGEIYKSLCNTNLNKDFWELIYSIIKIVRNNQLLSINEIYSKLQKDYSDLTYLSILNKDYYMLYLISCIKEKYKK